MFLGPAGLGALKAAQGLVNGPSTVLLQAGGSIGLPEASRAYDKSGWKALNRVGLVVTAGGVASLGLILLVLIFFGRFLLTFFYGAQFGQYASVAIIMAVSYLIMVCGLGAILKLKATKQTHLLFFVSIVAAVPSTLAVVALTPELGVIGAAYAFAIGMASFMIGQVVAARFVARRDQSNDAVLTQSATEPMEARPPAAVSA